MADLDERLHDLVAAAGRDVRPPPVAGVRRRGTRRWRARTGLTLLVIALLVGGGGALGGLVLGGEDQTAFVVPAEQEVPRPGQAVPLFVPVTGPVTDPTHLPIPITELISGSPTEKEDPADFNLWRFEPLPGAPGRYRLEHPVPDQEKRRCLTSRPTEPGFNGPGIVVCRTTDAGQSWRVAPAAGGLWIYGLSWSTESGLSVATTSSRAFVATTQQQWKGPHLVPSPA